MPQFMTRRHLNEHQSLKAPRASRMRGRPATPPAVVRTKPSGKPWTPERPTPSSSTVPWSWPASTPSKVGLWERAEAGDVKAANAVLRIIEQGARFFGLNKPEAAPVGSEELAIQRTGSS